MWVGKCVRCPVGGGHVIVQPLWRAGSGDTRLPACKFSQESRMGPAMPMHLLVPLCNPAQELEAVCWWESRVVVGWGLWIALTGYVRGDSPQVGRTPS